MNQKHYRRIYHANVNVNLMVENVIETKSGITINVGASVKMEKKYRVCEKDYIWNLAICN